MSRFAEESGQAVMDRQIGIDRNSVGILSGLNKIFTDADSLALTVAGMRGRRPLAQSDVVSNRTHPRSST